MADRKYSPITAIKKLVQVAEQVAAVGTADDQRRARKALASYDALMDRAGQHKQAITTARFKYADGSDDDLEIDDDPMVSDSEDGVFINAWVYVRNEEL